MDDIRGTFRGNRFSEDGPVTAISIRQEELHRRGCGRAAEGAPAPGLGLTALAQRVAARHQHERDVEREAHGALEGLRCVLQRFAAVGQLLALGGQVCLEAALGGLVLQQAAQHALWLGGGGGEGKDSVR